MDAPLTKKEQKMGKAKQRQQGKQQPVGLLQKWFPTPLRERFCKTCGRPYVGAVEPVPTRRFSLGNVEIQLFETMQFGRLKFELRVQRWCRYREEWHPQSIFSTEDFQHLAVLVEHALRVIQPESTSRGR